MVVIHVFCWVTQIMKMGKNRAKQYLVSDVSTEPPFKDREPLDSALVCCICKIYFKDTMTPYPLWSFISLAKLARELQKSYEQFLRHMKLRKNKSRPQERRATIAARCTHSYNKENEKANQVTCKAEAGTFGANLKVKNSDLKGVDAKMFKEDISIDKWSGISEGILFF